MASILIDDDDYYRLKSIISTKIFDSTSSIEYNESINDILELREVTDNV